MSCTAATKFGHEARRRRQPCTNVRENTWDAACGWAKGLAPQRPGREPRRGSGRPTTSLGPSRSLGTAGASPVVISWNFHVPPPASLPGLEQCTLWYPG